MESREVQAPETDLLIPEVSAEGLQHIVDKCMDLTLASQRFKAAADHGRAPAFSHDTRENYENAHRFDKKARKITKMLDRILPLPDGESWKDEIKRRIEVEQEALR